MIDEPFQPDPRDPSDLPAFDQPSADSLDGAVLKSLMLLTSGDLVSFNEFQLPPSKIRAWIDQANRRQVHGLLISTLHRWHELRRRESNETEND